MLILTVFSEYTLELGTAYKKTLYLYIIFHYRWGYVDDRKEKQVILEDIIYEKEMQAHIL